MDNFEDAIICYTYDDIYNNISINKIFCEECYGTC